MTDETTHYETLFIVHPVHSGRNQALWDRFRGVLEGQGATVTHFEEWGMRDLAYPIQKQNRGLYNLVQYQASAGTSDELERVMRLSDEVIRCMTVVLDEDVLPLARAEEATRATEAAQTVETAPAAEPAPAADPEPAAAAVESAPAPDAPADSAPSDPAPDAPAATEVAESVQEDSKE